MELRYKDVAEILAYGLRRAKMDTEEIEQRRRE